MTEGRIWSFIKDNQFDRPIAEEQPTDGQGIAGYMHLEIKGPAASTVHMVCKTNSWGSDEYVKETWGASPDNYDMNLKTARQVKMMKPLIPMMLLMLMIILHGGFALAGDEPAGVPLAVTLKYVESSKDSNWRQFKVEIQGNKILLSKEFGGFNALENEYVEKTLDADLEGRIWTFIKDNQLDRPIAEEQPTNGTGVAGYLDLEIKGPAASTIHIVGKTNIWGSDEYVKETWGASFVESRTNIEHIDYFKKVESLFQLLWGLKQ